jgi:uncharacterized protein (DUF58 family)
MYYPAPGYDKITFSIMAAGALAYMLQKQKDAVSLTTFSDKVEIQTPIKSTPTHIHKILLDLQELMQKPDASKSTGVASVIHEIAEKIHRRSLVILFSDMFDNITESEKLFSALQHLKHNMHEVLIFHVTDKKTESDFAFEDRPYEFIDLETNEKIKLNPAQVKDDYQKYYKVFIMT